MCGEMKISLALLVAIVTSFLIHAQEISVSQRFLQPGLSMIALSGCQGITQGSLLYRNQWTGIFNNPISYRLSADGYAERFRSGWGLSVLHNRMANGFQQVTGIHGTLAPRFSVGKGTLITGVSYALQRHSIDWSQLVFGFPLPKMFPPFQTGSIPINQARHAHKALLAIGYVRGPWLVHVQSGYTNVPSFFNDQANGHLYDQEAYAAYQWSLTENVSIIPALFIGHETWRVQGYEDDIYSDLAPTLNVRIHSFLIGTSYHWEDRLIGQLGYLFGERVLFSYSYDLGLSSLGNQTVVAHEIGLRIVFDQRNDADTLIQIPWLL